MSSGCGDVLSLADLQTAKKHQIFEAEVITGKSGGVAGGADIDYATNPVTGQTQKTLPAVLRDAGFSPVSWDFSTGGTLTVNDRDKVVYDPVSKTWYSYAGALPVTVPASFNPVGNADWKPQTDPDLRSELFTMFGDGSFPEAIVYKYGLPNSVDGVAPLTLQKRLDVHINVMDFGAVGDGVTDDAAAFQAAVDATPYGGKLTIPTPATYYKIGATLTINKAITIEGTGGSAVYRAQMPCIKVSGSISAFKLVPTLDGYRFGYGISGVKFNNLMIEGPEIDSRGLYAICADESVNSGVYHIRECDFSGVHIRYFETGIRLLGTVYLNSFYNTHVLWCGTGCHIDKVDGANEGNSDQNRFFGCEFVLNNIGMVLSNVAYSGSQSIIGCTISENTTAGIVAGYNTIFYMSGSQIEANGIGVNIAIPSAVTNPATEGTKTIFGNWFLSNNYDIWVVKETTALTGGFAFPINIQSNTFAQTKERVLYVRAPTGAGEFDSRQFIFGSSNSYSGTDGVVGIVPPGMIEAEWKGYNGFKEDGKVALSCRMVGTDLTNVGLITIPYGKQCYVRYTCVSMPSLVSAGRTQGPASIEFVNVNNASSPVVIHQGTLVRSGSFLISRVATETSVSVNLNATSASLTGLAEIEYCIM